MIGDRRTFADNQGGNTVAEAIRAFGTYSEHRWPVSIATGYFDLGGFSVIADALEASPSVRILVGVEPHPPHAGRRHEVRGLEQNDIGGAVKELEAALVVERDLMPFDASTARQVERLLAFLQRPTTEVRIYRERFLHGKAFVFGHEAGVIAGSANFTAAGLCHNLELDLGQYEPERVVKTVGWFEDLWGRAEVFDLAAVFAARTETFDPYTVYLRMLLELYGGEPELVDEEAPAIPAGGMRLASFQRLGVLRAKRILAEYSGVLIADGVGLGKTFIAGDLLRSAIHDEGIRVLLVTPASLRDSVWERFLTRYQLGVENLSYQELAVDIQVGGPARPGGPDGRKPNLGSRAEEYRLIVVDEAHAFRNPDTLHYKALKRLIAAGGTKKRVVLLTATPVNNSLWDLYYQIMLFARHEAAFADLGISSLYELFDTARRMDPESLTPHLLFPVLDAISVRRTRRHIQRYYADELFGDPPRRIRFPKPRLRSCRYRLSESLPGFFADVAAAIEDRLTLAAYVPDEYRTTVVPTGRQEVLAGLLRSQLLKRFESSLGAFRLTLSRLIDTNDRFLGALGRGIVLLREVDPDELDDELGEDVLDEATDDGSIVAPARLYDVQKLGDDVRADRALLADLLARAEKIAPEDDPKLNALISLLHETGGAVTADARKVVVFSYFADTVDYVKRRLDALDPPDLGPYAGRYEAVTGAASSEQRRRVVWSFVPKSSEAPAGGEDRLDLLIATDALAEGQNLQQAGKLINFDLPWNPMRIVQRNGRIDRIGSEHETVTLYTFFPETELDDLLGLEARLRAKIAQANAAVGVETPPIPGAAVAERTFADAEETIRAVADEDETVLEREEERVDAFSGEILREELRRALIAGRGTELRALPWGGGSGHRNEGRHSVVFAARVGDEAIWRGVPLEEGELVEDRLALLDVARCTPEATRHFPEPVRERLFGLWEQARTSIHDSYMTRLDPLARHAAVPKAQQDAVTFLQGVATAGAAEAIRALQVPWPLTVARAIRPLLHALERPDADPEQVARQLIELVRDEGLRPPAPRAAPIPIEPEDVHLVCFQVVSS